MMLSACAPVNRFREIHDLSTRNFFATEIVPKKSPIHEQVRPQIGAISFSLASSGSLRARLFGAKTFAAPAAPKVRPRANVAKFQECDGAGGAPSTSKNNSSA